MPYWEPGGLLICYPLKFVPQMPEHGVIFSDGIEADYLDFNSGMQAMISIAEKKGHLVV